MDATVTVPGSKSVTNRALVLAALGDRPTRLRRLLRSRDTMLMAAALRALGVEIRDTREDLVVRPAPLRGPAEVDVGLAGTVMRFLPPVAALADGTVTFDGDPRARQRPMRPMIDALRHLGVDVDDDGGALPLTVRGRGWVLGGHVGIDASLSSQFVSGLLLAAPRFVSGLELRHIGPRMPSLPHVHLTVAMLRSRGVIVEHTEPAVWRVEPGPIEGLDVTVEPDLSNAAPFLAAALVTAGRVTVRDWPLETMQPGRALPQLLMEMGAHCEQDEEGLTVTGTGGIRGLDADLREVGELVPVLAALAALADGPSTLRGVSHLRGHETDRLAALARELNALGGDVTERADGLVIRPRPLHGGVFSTYADHRLATAAAVIGLAVPGVAVSDVETTAKTLPGFVDLWASLLGSPSR